MDYYDGILKECSGADNTKARDFNNTLKLLDQMIEVAEAEDQEFKKRAIAAHKGSQAIGESWMVFHLKALRELIEKNGNV